MLKFKDLKLDMKSFKNSLDFCQRMYSNSYIPLLLIYLSREGLLRIENDVNEDDPRILIRITSKSIKEFWGIKDTLPYNNDDIAESILGVDFFDKDLTEKYDYHILVSCVNMINRGLNESSYAFVFDNSVNNDFYRIKDILIKDSVQYNEPAALWLIGEIILNKKSNKNDGLGKYYDTLLFDLFLNIRQHSANIGTNIQPKELTRIILSQYKGGSVYNPFAGLGSYHVEMSHGLKKEAECNLCPYTNVDYYYNEDNSLGEQYYAEEINEFTWALGKLRLMCYHMDSPNYVLGDSTKGYEGIVNNVFSTPPFNYQIINENGEEEFADHFVLRRGARMLAKDGLMAVVVPMSFLNRKDTLDIRKDLIINHMLSHVVYLPDKIFSSTRISTAIIFVRNKSKRRNVKFVDATKMTYGEDGNVLNIAAISNLIEHHDYPQKDWGFTFGDFGSCEELTPNIFKSLISYESFKAIADNDYDLSPSNYFSSYIIIPEGFKLERLDNLISPKKLLKASIEGKQIIVSPNDLSKDFHFPYIDREKLAAGIATQNFKLLEKDEKALLISSIGELRPSIISPVTGDVYISPHILAFYIDEKRVDPEYLILELSKDYVKEQMRFFMMDSTIHIIKSSVLLKLQILVPSGEDWLKIEKEISQEDKNEYLERMGVELAELKDRRHNEYVKMLRQRKHRLQQIMNEFSPAFSQLNNFRIKQGGILYDNDVVAERTGDTVGTYFNKLNSIVLKIEDLISNLVNKENWGESKTIDIDKFVENLSHNHISDIFEIQIFHDRNYEIWEEGEMAELNNTRYVRINDDSLSTIFENIFANALKWGFDESYRRDYIIRIIVSDSVINNMNAVRISITNNGTPIHETVDRSRFFEWGYGTGTGMGTSQLKDIVEHYGGSVKLNEFPDDPAGFCTEYEIVLPIIDNN